MLKQIEKMRKILLLLFAVLFAASCSRSGYEISGTLDNAEGKMVLLQHVERNRVKTIDSVVVDPAGHFRITGELEYPDYYLFGKGDNESLTLILEPGQKITITGDLENIQNTSEITGSPGSMLIREFNTRLEETLNELRGLNKIYNDSLGSPDMADIMEDLRERSKKIIEEQKEYSIEFIENNLGSLASVLALYQKVSPRRTVFNFMEDYKYFIMVDSAIYEKYNYSDAARALHTHVSEIKKELKRIEKKNELLGLGSVSPEIALPSPEGDTIRLSSTRGKIVLLDFWAAWCKPCRYENPNLVANYEKYSDKGFEIFQVSLDKTREEWLKGIEEDNLGEWIHVSDLKFWNSVVVPAYYIEGIPTNFLLDREGKIIAKNVRGENLSNELKEIFE